MKRDLQPKGLGLVVAMANQKTLLNDSPRDGHDRSNQVKIALALTVALVSPAASMGKPCQAADFRHAKKIIVPATNIPRRYDYSSSSGRESGLPSGYESNYDSSYAGADPTYGSTSSSTSAKVSKYGLVPPPPPVTPSLLPSSMARDVPPPPTAPAMASRSSSSPSASSTNSHKGFQQTNGDPSRSTSLERHVINSKSNKLGAENSVISQITAQADALTKEGKLQEAQDLLEKYEKTYPKNTTLDHKLSQVSLERAKYYVRKDDYVEGAKQARIALHHNSNSIEAKNVLDQILRHHGVDPTHAASRVKMGDMLFSQGKLKEARAEYDSALKIHHSGEAYIGLGNIALRENKLKEAKAHYQLALEKEPESSVALRQLGIVRYKLKDVVGANADLSRALVLNQDDKHASQTLIELWQRQVSMRPNDANSHLGLARAHQLAGDLKSAQNSYRTVVSIDPNHPNLPAARQSFKLALARQEAQKTYDAAKTLDASGAIPEAYTKAGESVSLSPGDVKFRLYQAELAERLGNYPDAKQLYIEVLRQDPKNQIAAQKIKSLAGILSAGDTAQSLRGPLDSSQGLQAQAGSLAAPPAVATDSASLLGAGLPRLRGEGPALSSLPTAPGVPTKLPTADPVNSMSGFLGDLRNFMVVQKKQLQKEEDSVLEAVSGKSSSAKAAALPDLPPLPSSGSVDTALPKNMISSDDIQKLLARTGTAPASPAANNAIGSSGGATSAGDISRILSGNGTAGSAASTGAGMAGLDAATIGAALSSGRLPQGISAQDVGRILGGMSGPGAASPPMSSNSGYSAGNSRVGETILSSPRNSETVLKVADTPPASEVMPPVAPSRATFAPRFDAGAGAFDNGALARSTPAVSAPLFATPLFAAPPVATQPMPPYDPQPAPEYDQQPQQAYAPQNSQSYAPQATPPIGGTPQLSPELLGLAAQAKSLSPEALAGIARSVGIEPAHITALANQALAQAPQLMNAAPGLINKGIASLKQEDIDKMAALLKHHVALKQQAIGMTIPKTTTAPTKVTTKATPQLVKKVDIKNHRTATAPTKAAPKSPTVTKVATAKPASKPASSSSPSSSAPKNSLANNNFDENALRAATGSTPIVHEAPLAQAVEDTNTASAAAVAISPVNNQRMDSLEAQNKSLLSQLEDTKKQLQELRESALTKPAKQSKSTLKRTKQSAKSTKTSTSSTNDGSTRIQTPANSFDNSTPPLSGQMPQSGGPEETAAPLKNPIPMASNPSGTSNFAVSDIASPVSTLASLPAGGQTPLDSASFINLELSGINVRPKGVRLNVVLRNGTGKELALPTKTKAVVRMVGAPDQMADVIFPVKALTPGQEAKGYISVSGHKLDPSADVFIPKLMSTESGQRDVHLTVPISALSNIPH